MNSRTILMIALLATPAWSQEPAAPAPVLAATRLDLQSDAVRKIVRDTAATQYSDARASNEGAVRTEPAAYVFVPPDDLSEVPVREAPKQQSAPEPAPASKGNTFLSSVFEILIDEALDREEDDGVTSSNEMLRCRIQKEQKTSPPGIDNCPSVD